MKTISNFLLWIVLIGISAVSVSCTDDTLGIGTSLMPSGDGLIVSQDTFYLKTRSVTVDSVYANTNSCYFGKIVDPETKTETTCNFLAQFHMPNQYKFPSKENMLLDNAGDAIADSAEIRIFLKGYKGDSLAPMKLLVQELDTNRVMEEGTKYFSNINPENYVNSNGGLKKSLIYTVKDLSLDDTLLTSSNYYANIRIKLPQSYAKYLLNSYYKHPSYYSNSYNFIHHVCPGFYFKSSGGVGVLSQVDVSVINLYFRYYTRKTSSSAKPDTLVGGFQRIAATEEVLQNTHVSNTGIASLAADNSCTYLKSPSGLFTEVSLPIDSVVAGEHYNDTINSASITFRRQNDTSQNLYALTPPTTVLLVRKSDMYSFFENDKLPDSKSSYITKYSSTYNGYTYSNIGRLLTLCKLERDNGAGVVVGESEAARNAKYKVWEAANPDWNKIMLIPVKADYVSTTNSTTGTTTSTLLRVRNEMGLYSTRLLKGGAEGNIVMSVIYSKFAN